MLAHSTSFFHDSVALTLNFNTIRFANKIPWCKVACSMTSLTPELCQKIEALMTQASEGNILQSVKQIFHLLQQSNLMWDMKIHPRIIGCHPDNRDGYGINVLDVHSWLSDVFTIGFDHGEVKAVCCEVAQDDTSVQSFNEKMVMAAGNQLAPVDGRLKYATLWGGHTNQAMRLVAYNMPHCDERLTVGGRLSLEKIGLTDAIFHDAVSNGVVWKVIAFDVVKRFSELPTLVQSAGNAASQIAKVEHELQVLRKMWVTQMRLYRAQPGVAVTFADVKARIMKTKPACAASLAGMYTFMIKFAGGHHALFLLETELFVKNNAPSNKMIPAECWSLLSMDVKGSEQGIRFRHAVLKALYVESFKLSTSDIRRCFHKEVLPQMFLANDMMVKLRDYVTTNGIDTPEVASALSRFDISVVAWVLGKSTHGSLHEVAHSFVVEARALTQKSLVSPWEPASTASSSVGVPAPTHAMREFKTDGTLADPAVILLEQGFVVGSTVQRKTDKMVASVKSFIGSDVVLQAASGEILASVEAFQTKEWIKHEVKSKPDAIMNWVAHSAHTSKEFQVARVKGMIIHELCELSIKHATNYDQLSLFTKPHKSVVALSKIEKNKLVLVSSSTKITNGSEGHHFVAEVKGEKYWVTPHTTLPGTKATNPFIAPFWFVEKQADANLVNMEISAVSVKNADVGTFWFTIMKNVKALNPDDVLYVLDSSKTKASEVKKSAATPGDSKSQPKKPRSN